MMNVFEGIGERHRSGKVVKVVSVDPKESVD